MSCCSWFADFLKLQNKDLRNNLFSNSQPQFSNAVFLPISQQDICSYSKAYYGIFPTVSSQKKKKLEKLLGDKIAKEYHKTAL